MNEPDTARGKRLEAAALRAGAQRLLDNARDLDRLADLQDEVDNDKSLSRLEAIRDELLGETDLQEGPGGDGMVP